MLLGLSSKVPSVIEKAFQTLAYLFKELSKDLVKDPAACWGLVKEGFGASPVQTSMPIEEEEPLKPEDASDEEDELEEVEQSAQSEVMQVDEPEESLDELEEPLAEDDAEIPSATIEIIEQEQADDSKAQQMAAELHLKRIRQSANISRRARGNAPLRKLLASVFAYALRKASAAELSQLLRLVIVDLIALQQNSNPAATMLSISLAHMTLESARAVEHRLHSKGPAVYKALISETVRLRPSGDSLVLQALEGALTGLIHHSRVDLFDAMTQTCLAECREIIASTPDRHALTTPMRVMARLVGVRRGGRISPEHRSTCFQLFEQMSKRIGETDDSTFDSEFAALAVNMFMWAKLEDMLSVGRSVLETIFSQVGVLFSAIA